MRYILLACALLLAGNAAARAQYAQAMQGSVLQSWYAPNLTGNRRIGVGDWSVNDIALYLKTGRNRFDIASGPMADAVTHSTSHLTDADLRAIAVYLKKVATLTVASPMS